MRTVKLLLCDKSRATEQACKSGVIITNHRPTSLATVLGTYTALIDFINEYYRHGEISRHYIKQITEVDDAL